MTSSSHINAAIVLKHSGIIAHQTDTVFGLACLPTKKLLVRLTKIKNRAAHKNFILLTSNSDQVVDFIHADEKTLQILNTPTKTPTTWLVDASSNVPPQLLGATHKVAIRISQHPSIKKLCEEAGAIASTSANISNQETCTNAQQVRAVFGPNIDFIDQNQTPGSGKSSTIIDLNSGDVLRR